MSRAAMRFAYHTRSGREIDVELPARFEVCDRCRGNGTHVNPAIDGHGISHEDFAEDPDFEEGYFSGRYDIRCEECDGERVVKVVDPDAFPPTRRKKLQARCDAIDAAAAEVAQARADDAVTRFWENGGRE